jgi:A1 cistron-splicing factor AAR2
MLKLSKSKSLQPYPILQKFRANLIREVSVAELRIQKDGLPEIFDKLQAYNTSSSSLATQAGSAVNTTFSNSLTKDPNIWHHLTSSMKGALLSKITGHEWNHWQVSSTHDYKPAAKLASSVPDDPLDFGMDEVLNFVFPKALRTFTSASIGRDRTEQAMDTSAHIMAVITGSCTYEDSDEIIGELQFCYVTGMILGNVACMEHWAHIVKVVFKAFRLALDFPTFFRKFVEAVHAQFIYDEEGLEGSILDHDSSLSDDLRIILTVFKSRLNELLLAQGGDLTPEQNEVGKAFEELESWLWKWGWDLRGNYVRSGKVCYSLDSCFR